MRTAADTGHSRHNRESDPINSFHEVAIDEDAMPKTTTNVATSIRFPKKVQAADAGKPASELIDQRIADLQDWRGVVLAALRDVIRGADPEITEEWKWNAPVWSCAGIICTGEAYKKAVKLTFPKGAALADPACLFNASLEGNVRRAIDFSEGGSIDSKALTALVRAAIALNKSSHKAKRAGAA